MALIFRKCILLHKAIKKNGNGIEKKLAIADFITPAQQ